MLTNLFNAPGLWPMRAMFTVAFAVTFSGALSATSHAAAGAVAVSAGGMHTCAITTAGALRCWGDNSKGQLGNGGDGTQQPIEVRVQRLAKGVAAVSAGFEHTCALVNVNEDTATGIVECWGFNENGQVGDGTQTDRNVPTAVAGLRRNVAMVGAGGDFTCALVVNPQNAAKIVECWGNNSGGQLGNGTNDTSLVPTAIRGLTGVASLAVGRGHACIVTTAGGVKCWGLNGSGQLGTGDKVARNTPTDVVGLQSGIVAVAAGGFNTCALTTTGGVKCWGSNVFNGVGNGSDTTQLTPVNVSGLTRGVSAISVGESHGCAVMARTSRVVCWGDDNEGELGDGDQQNKPTPVAVHRLGTVAAIELGELHSCALLTNPGAIKCWGNNINGEIGDGSFGIDNDKLIPTRVRGF